MVRREVKWTLKSINDKIEIFNYWINRNKSTDYSVKLNLLFKKAMEITSLFSYSGTPTEITDVRIRFVRNYKLVYKITKTKI